MIDTERPPDDLKALTLDDALVHSWLGGDELKLQFYVEREEASSPRSTSPSRRRRSMRASIAATTS